LGKQYKSLNTTDIEFIKQQKLFYLASCSNHEVNLSPRGYESIYIHDENTLYMIDYLGSGNRTARDIGEDGEVTLVFNAFEGAPKILRCFCKGEVFSKESKDFEQASQHFSADMNAIRQIFKFTIYAVETSCGMGVPLMQYKEERPQVRNFALKMHKQNKFNSYEKDHAVPPNLQKL
jgi:hypothetical protein